MSESDLSVSTVRSRHIFGSHPRTKISNPRLEQKSRKGVLTFLLQSRYDEIHLENDFINPTKLSEFI